MMGVVLSLISGVIAPLFMIVSPITSYADQILSIHRSKSSAGFSLDIPLIMLTASILRIFYYPGAQYDRSLLIQSFIMIVMQTLLLKVALDNRPSHSSNGGEAAIPFAAAREGDMGVARPYNFWQWRSSKPYWQFLLYFFITLTALELILAPVLPIYENYSPFVGYLGLSIEALLPIPQIISNSKTQSCRGFRLSVLANWLAGDMMKMFWFFTATSAIPWAFKMCGIFQMGCDVFLGIQFWVYGHGKDPLKDNVHLNGQSVGGLRAPNRARTPLGDKDGRLD